MPDEIEMAFDLMLERRKELRREYDKASWGVFNRYEHYENTVKFVEATNEFEQAVLNYGYLAGRDRQKRTWLEKIRRFFRS